MASEGSRVACHVHVAPIRVIQENLTRIQIDNLREEARRIIHSTPNPSTRSGNDFIEEFIK
jgi:hypothetical protein